MKNNKEETTEYVLTGIEPFNEETYVGVLHVALTPKQVCKFVLQKTKDNPEPVMLELIPRKEPTQEEGAVREEPNNKQPIGKKKVNVDPDFPELEEDDDAEYLD